MPSRARVRLVALSSALLILFGAMGPVAADEPEPPTTDPDAAYATDQVVVKWRDAGDAPAEAAEHGLGSVESLDPDDPADAPTVVETNGRPVETVLAELNADPAVEYAEPDYIVSLATDGVVTGPVIVNDPSTGDQYSLDRMRVRDAWSLTTGGSGVVAVLDTGVQYTHPDLTGRLLAGHDFVNDDGDAADDNGHGTWVAGIIAARANDGWGIAGVTWSDKILPVKVMNANGTGVSSDLTAGIIWAADHGATVINMSVGGFPHSTYVQDAVNHAWSKGAVLVGAAGNNRRDEIFYPASYDNVVSVSATQADDEFANWSSYGAKVDVSAPGASVLTTNCQKSRTSTCAYYGEHITISGTSFATPNVAGVVALIRARYPSWSNQQVVDRLIATVDDLGYAGWDKRYGRGRVNALRALGGASAAIPISTGDGWETNNALAASRRISLGTTISPTIHPAGDVDVFAVDVPRAGRLDVRVTAVTDTVRPAKSSLPVDPIVQLYSSAGALLLTVDNASSSAATELAQLNVAGAQRILIRVENWFPNGTKTPYTVRADYVDTVAPKVVGRSPAPGTTGVNRFPSVTATFDETVTGVSASSIRLRDTSTNALAPVSVTYNGSTRTATIRATAQLAATRTYRLEVTGGVRDVAGNGASASWDFTTGLYGFSDIADSGFIPNIIWLAESGITTGCTPERFCPTQPVTRAQMASFLVRALNLPATTTDFFTDDEGSAHEKDINRLAASGITGGCGPGRFCPGSTVTRAQMASFLVRALNLPATGTDFFTDDETSAHERDINRLAASGITGGCATSRFCPSGAVTREQMAAFLHRAFR